MIESAVQQLVAVLLGTALMMFLLWGIQLKTGDAGLVDFGWSLGLGLAALFYCWTSPGLVERRVLLAGLASFWAFRLALYLLVNRVLRGDEDGRYRELRRKWGSKAPFYFLIFFQFQSLLVVGFSIPYLIVSHNSRSPLGWMDFLGVIILVAAVLGESLADRQLARFRAQSQNRGKTCREGLWRYSRHPNYFFEWLHWWAWVPMAVGSPWWWLTLVGPALMLFFLFKVTGIPATEAQALASRGEDYRKYQATTSAFFPWFPKEDQK